MERRRSPRTPSSLRRRTIGNNNDWEQHGETLRLADFSRRRMTLRSERQNDQDTNIPTFGVGGRTRIRSVTSPRSPTQGHVTPNRPAPARAIVDGFPVDPSESARINKDAAAEAASTLSLGSAAAMCILSPSVHFGATKETSHGSRALRRGFRPTLALSIVCRMLARSVVFAKGNAR